MEENIPCPYLGLSPFLPEHAEFFFGRDVFVQELVRATQTRNFISVLGASGSGKSSLVFAGLIPQLQKAGNWHIADFRPGSDKDPFYPAAALVPLYRSEIDSTDKITQAGNLANSLKEGTTPLSRIFSTIQHYYPNYWLLLIIDQFEEIYTLNDEGIHRKFIDCLLDGLQIDFLGNALSYPRFADVLQNADIKIRLMDQKELSQTIQKPADKFGVTKEIGSFPGHLYWFNNVSFSPDGKTLASASDDKTIKLWSFDIDRLLTLSCDRVYDYLHNPSVNLSYSDRHLCDGYGTKR